MLCKDAFALLVRCMHVAPADYYARQQWYMDVRKLSLNIARIHVHTLPQTKICTCDGYMIYGDPTLGRWSARRSFDGVRKNVTCQADGALGGSFDILTSVRECWCKPWSLVSAEEKKYFGVKPPTVLSALNTR